MPWVHVMNAVFVPFVRKKALAFLHQRAALCTAPFHALEGKEPVCWRMALAMQRTSQSGSGSSAIGMKLLTIKEWRSDKSNLGQTPQLESPVVPHWDWSPLRAEGFALGSRAALLVPPSSCWMTGPISVKTKFSVLTQQVSHRWLKASGC